MEQIYTPTKDYKVLVRCMTYNQSKYIKDALNGFAMQKTDFPFVCLVVDDASTDGEQEVIKSWMAHECDMTQADNVEIEKSFVTLVPHKKNANCTFAFYFLKENLYGTGEKTPLIAPWREHCKYEALCEGDDYWIDETKIQRQSYILDTYPNIQMVYTDYETVDEKSFPIYREKYEKILKPMSKTGDNLPFLMKRNYPLTVTILIRKEIIENEFYKNSPSTIDYALFLAAAFVGDFYYMSEKTSAYRLNPNSLTQKQKDKIIEALLEIKKYASQVYVCENVKKENLKNDIKIGYQILYHSIYPNVKIQYKGFWKLIIKKRPLFFLCIPIVFAIKVIKNIIKHEE